MTEISEPAYAKLNLVLRVGSPRADGMHPLCSLFASVDLADRVVVTVGAASDEVVCEGVPGPNLAAAAIAAFRTAIPDSGVPPLRVAIEKRIPVAAGLGGGSADAAAVLRVLARRSERPPEPELLLELAAGLGADVPSQLEPRHALVTGIGETVEPIALPPIAFVLVPSPEGLSTATVFAELDRLASFAPSLDMGPLRALAAGEIEQIAGRLANDLEPAALSLRPELSSTLDELRGAGALAAQVTGSGPTVFGIFPDRAAAERGAAAIPGAIVTETRGR